MLYRLSYTPTKLERTARIELASYCLEGRKPANGPRPRGAGSVNRTRAIRITSAALYLLSYPGKNLKRLRRLSKNEHYP